MKKYIQLFILFILPYTMQAKERWEIYNTFKSYTQIEGFHDALYVRAGNAVFVTNLEMDDTESITKIDGLSTSNIQFITKSEEADKLVFIHHDGTIDLMDANHKISSIYDLKEKALAGDKTINHFVICGKKLFLACGFGYVEFDLSSELATSYYFTPSDCNFAFAFAGNYYYALITGGLWRCEKDRNMAIEENWKQTETKKILDVTVFNSAGTEQCWIVDQDKDIHILNQDGSHRKSSTRKCYEQLKSSGNYVFAKGQDLNIIKKEDQSVTYLQTSPYNTCRDYFAANDSTVYAVHPSKGLIKYSMGFRSSTHAKLTLLAEPNNYYEIAGDQISELSFNQGTLAAISGYKMYASSFMEMCLANTAVNYYQDENWSHISESDVQKQALASKEFRGLTNVAADPNIENRFYVSTLTSGVYQFDGDSLTRHHFTSERISAVNCDDNSQLWAAKALSDTTLWSYDQKTDHWVGHPIENFIQQSNIGRIIIQQNEPHHLIWANNNYSYHKSRIGILYNPKGGNDASADQSAFISTLQDQDNIQYSFANAITTVYDIQEDEDGKIWILTNIGPFVVEDVIKTFNHAQKNPGIGLVKRIKVPRNDGTNLADYLLTTTTCTAMVTDRLNRKWIGTLNEGIYLLSSDGLEEIEHFTTDNAPLCSNDITALAYDEVEKRLFIACDGGMVILHTEDIEPADDFSSFHCYPNPLRPEYYGDIEITGLMENSIVSVTDAVGNLIWKTQVTSGHTSWNGCDNNGNRVAAGVYLIHGISEGKSKGEIVKMLVL